MAQKALIIPPESALEYLLDEGYLEETDSYPNYRIAMNPDTFRVYSITELSNALAKVFHVGKTISKCYHKKPYLRELYKCLNQYQIQYEDRVTKANEHWEFKLTIKKYLEQKLGIDLDALHEHDRAVRSSKRTGGMRYTSYFNQAKGRYGEERALKLFERYFHRRMENLDKDCRHGKPQKAKFEDEVSDMPLSKMPLSKMPLTAHKQLYKA